MTSLRTDGLSSGLDHPRLMHSETDFTPSPRQEKSKKAMSNSPSRPMSDRITMGTSSTFDRLMISMGRRRIVLPQMYQTELLTRSYDLMGHQGVDKVYYRIQKQFEWPGLKKACEKWISACLSCQQAKDSRKLRIPLQSIESSGFNEVVQIDHQKLCMTTTGYNQVLVMIDHFAKYAVAAPCMTARAEETCDHLINVWIARHGCPITFQRTMAKHS